MPFTTSEGYLLRKRSYFDLSLFLINLSMTLDEMEDDKSPGLDGFF
jgi:hypothetical protein